MAALLIYRFEYHDVPESLFRIFFVLFGHFRKRDLLRISPHYHLSETNVYFPLQWLRGNSDLRFSAQPSRCNHVRMENVG
jgi:hypothetical protein